MSKATVFHHFRTLDEISVAALDRFWASLLTLDAAGTTSARGYLEGLAKQLGSVAGKRKILLYAHSVFLVKAMFNPSLRKLLVSVSAHMHQVTMRELSQRLSNDLSREEIETATRMVEMILDGMMINTALNHNTKALKAATRAWNRFLDILLRDLERAG